MNDKVQYHEGILAIKVKDHHNYSLDHRFTRFTEQELQSAYEDCQLAFWTFYAPQIAAHYEYGKVYQEGRSGGWLTVECEPDIFDDDNQPNDEHAKWLDFQHEIYDEMDFCCNERLLEILNETKTAVIQEYKEQQDMAARDIITI